MILTPRETVAGFAVQVSEIPLSESRFERMQTAYNAVKTQFPEYRVTRYELADASEGIFWLEQMSRLKFAKPLKRATVKRKKRTAKNANTKTVRAYVFEREDFCCRCCKARRAMSMHEIRPRSLGGKISPTNSVALCGTGTTGCHGRLQRHEVICQPLTRSGRGLV